MDKHEYVLLFEKHLAGLTSLEEEKLLNDHQDDFGLTEFSWDESKMGDKAKVRKMLFKKLQKDINPTLLSRIDYRRWSIAAAVILISSFGIYYSINRAQKPEVPQHLVKQIVPGGNKAILTLSNGSEVMLSNVGSVEPIIDGIAIIANKEKGVLVYNSNASMGAAKTEDLFNTISTPRGGYYQVVLPDGTKVWLNAASSLSFPTSFSGLERRVQLKGEAYFEVAKNTKMPFKVDVNGLAVKVLGTHFNIMAYDDEQYISTTLLEGSVEIANSKIAQMLKPGEQATLKKADGSIGIAKVNTTESVAWKNGDFMFTDENIESIMRKIARWYDVDVNYKGNLSDKFFAGYISKDEDLSEVLKMLELTGTIHFKVEGRRVLVMP